MLALLAEAALRAAVLMGVTWMGLRLLRVTNPFVQMAVWVGVLGFSLVMPVLMQLVPADRAVVPMDGLRLWLRPTAGLPPPLSAPLVGPADVAPVQTGLDWRAWAFYLLGAIIMLSRLLIGALASLRLLIAAQPVTADWVQGRRVRTSPGITVPLTIAGSVLLPPDYPDWTDLKRRAVLAHETSHVERRDYYTLLLAGLYRALFWFSPAAWWLNNHLAELAEANSDTDALTQMEDRLNYAEILVEMARKARRLPPGLAMARPSTVASRVDRILKSSTSPLRMSFGRWALVLAVLAPTAIATAATGNADKRAAEAAEQARLHAATAQSEADFDREVEERLADQARPRTAIPLDPAAYDKFVGYYAQPLDQRRPLKVYRDGTRLLANAIGEQPVEFMPESPTKVFAKDMPMQYSFELDGAGRVTGLVQHERGQELPLPRLDDASGKALETALATHIQSNQPTPGAEAALRALIAKAQAEEDAAGDRVVDRADGVIKEPLPRWHFMFKPLGAVRKVEFRGVDNTGFDKYRVTYDKSAQDWSVFLTQQNNGESWMIGNSIEVDLDQQ